MLTNTSGNHWTDCGDAPSTNEDPPEQDYDCFNCRDTGRVTDHEGMDYECGCVEEDRKMMRDIKAEQDDEARKADGYDRAGDR